MLTLGIDTSNYTTSVAVFNSTTGAVFQRKRLLPVKEGEKGLRQSDAVFHHTSRLYSLFEELMNEVYLSGENTISAVGASEKPRDAEGSYMPCFLVGTNTARCIAASMNKSFHGFSHQAGHIAAALYSSGSLELCEKEFIAFHVSGGTTEALLVKPDAERIFKVEEIGKTLDLNCGQAVDRVGVMLGIPFPCGKDLELLAMKSEKVFKPKVYIKNGNCSLSGLENQCKKMFENGEKTEDIARYCLDFVAVTIEKMADHACEKFSGLPIVFAGGVMSDSIIKDRLLRKFDALFAKPEFSCDNAVGTAILTYLREKTSL